MNPELPVRSAVLKHCTGGLVVRWVTTSEYPLLYVFVFLFARLVVCLLVTDEYNMIGRYSHTYAPMLEDIAEA